VKEYAKESKDPNPAIRDLSPVNDDNLFKWRGWLQGISGTPYEGFTSSLTLLTWYRRRMAHGSYNP
jgi:ubiquitin-protein ligase